MSKNTCEHCGFMKPNHSSVCHGESLRRLVETYADQRALWDKGWFAGFNGDPKPRLTSQEDPALVAIYGWLAGDEARRQLGN